MKNGKSEHFWRIHRRVMQRVWGELNDQQRDIIAADVDKTSQEYQWFVSRINNEAERVYADPASFPGNPNRWTGAIPVA